ncbi:hypothetical protein GCM10010412_050680 [Nonomuraea recticatena]|uniref:Uncharacterized protein n=1 Tax=Nonomuraea recticatena TaxID=46178 RepID=A0ABN3S967_9ACTN
MAVLLRGFDAFDEEPEEHGDLGDGGGGDEVGVQGRSEVRGQEQGEGVEEVAGASGAEEDAEGAGEQAGGVGEVSQTLART